ncbi:hypothetical protein RHMOL_Rhmol13G0260200 [Rhododendron molle]|uniref:Uncharacterized protein n=1 Tax=Rhododendron molle TaxID=49168 RepID=A0ACC0LCE0_RHOML|nr:hypothetical protein RHMOL_Rhmol13G0260200 [Rhododendron molle]
MLNYNHKANHRTLTRKQEITVIQAIGEDRPATWSELILQKEIDDLKLQGLGDREECMSKEATLAAFFSIT